MLGKIDKQPQLEIFKAVLTNFINSGHEIIQLSEKINWKKLEDELSPYYCLENGRPGIPIRKIAGVIILKRIFNESDESVLERWVENPYWQYFCGETYFQHNPPFDRTELIKFRQRIGEQGSEKILQSSIEIFSEKETREKDVLLDTTVQEKNITYPTDTKLHRKIILSCNKIAKKESLQLRQSYTRTLKQLMIDQRFRTHPKKRKKANAAARKIKTIAGRMVRDVERNLNLEQNENYKELFGIFHKILLQKKDSKDKIYSIHEPEVMCIAKGKEAKKYEYGNKTSIARTRKSGIIVGAIAFKENVYDGDTIGPQLNQIERIIPGYQPKIGIGDRGYRGRKTVNQTSIVIPHPLPSAANNYQKQKIRGQFRARAGIEPIIGHLKQDHRLSRNFLAKEIGNQINTVLAAAGFNFRKMLRRLKTLLKNWLYRLIYESYEQILEQLNQFFNPILNSKNLKFYLF